MPEIICLYSIKGALSILIRKVPFFNNTMMYAPRGPVCDVHDKETLKELVSGAKELKEGTVVLVAGFKPAQHATGKDRNREVC